MSRLHADLKAVIALPEVQQPIIRLGMVPDTRGAGPDALQSFINAEMARWGKVVRDAGLAGSQ